ncbi:hypothetical protein GCK72_015192 [Caenorhabditis remanei]|uniref:SUN domain-containing protein n=1 Tax=Caenorhabditis remanei TaxID=31234 RepID=A0A6A5GWL1_CAERE|nr:hypothetical protein GCK72_015192 [Caenorhabditis remanei]KAF1758732.1 hypothetical protein GCK72_015192 [Caenorhabditis remanei]
MVQPSIGKDLESANGSKVSSNAIEEPKTKKEIWYEWIRNRLRHYMILELLFSICLVLILWKLCHISSQISSIHSEFRDFRLDIESNRVSKPTDTINLNGGNKKIEEFVEQVMKDIKNPSKEYPKQVILTRDNSSTNNSVFQINAASLILGATVDSSRSSSSDNNPLFGRDQSGYVLIDRSDPPSDKAWCSNEENPILTIDLAKYIRPISVSYQHSKWSGMVPDGAPSRYDVLACLDYYCNNLEPLVTNCEYRATRENKQEQFCSIPFDSNLSSIGKVQFHFRQNHGNVMKTCAHTIRVYGETKDVPKVKEMTLKRAETCSELTYDYHHNPWIYKIFDYKNCTVLYSNDCCTECPECCDECVIKDTNFDTVAFCFLLDSKTAASQLTSFLSYSPVPEYLCLIEWRGSNTEKVPGLAETQVLYYWTGGKGDIFLANFKGRELYVYKGELNDSTVIKFLNDSKSNHGYLNLKVVNMIVNESYELHHDIIISQCNFKTFDSMENLPIFHYKQRNKIHPNVFKSLQFSSQYYIVWESDGYVASFKVQSNSIFFTAWNMNEKDFLEKHANNMFQ